MAAKQAQGKSRGGGAARLALIFLGPLATAAIAWSVVWLVAARQTDALIQSWIARESTLGRIWSCPGRHMAGYPLDVELICPGLEFKGAFSGASLSGALRGFRASASVLHPDLIVAQLQPPFTGKAEARDGEIALDWESLELTVAGRADSRADLSIEGRSLSVKATGALGGFEAEVRTAKASATPLAGDEAAVDFRIRLEGVAIPALAASAGLKAPLDAEAGGVIAGVAFSGVEPLANEIENWRLRGGRIDVNTLRLSSGEAHFDAQGVLDLDPEHRPRGKLDAAFAGLNPVLERLGVDPRVLAAGSLLTRFLGDAGDGSGDTRLPLRIADGAVSIGPIRTPFRLPPLY